MQQDGSEHLPVLFADFNNLGGWRPHAIILGSRETLAQQLGRMPIEQERVLLREPYDLEAVARLEPGEVRGHPVWFGVIDPETLVELDNSEAMAQFWEEHLHLRKQGE